MRRPDGEQKLSAELLNVRAVVIPDAVYALKVRKFWELMCWSVTLTLSYLQKDFIWPRIDEITRINEERDRLAAQYPKSSAKPPTSQRFQLCLHVRDPELYLLEDPKRLDTPRLLVRTDVIYRYLTDSHVDSLTYITSLMLEHFEIRKSSVEVS